MELLRKGDPAPLFEGKDQNGNTISLKNFIGKKIILYFYPKDMTPGCTDESCNLRDNHTELLKKGFVVIGVSADDAESHKKFIGKHKLPFALIADTDKKIINSYGAWGKKNKDGKTYEGILRTTYVINEKGLIEEVFAKVDTKNHTQQIFETLKL
jgi:thioredoxin-dependent peroxiredoxin